MSVKIELFNSKTGYKERLHYEQYLTHPKETTLYKIAHVIQLTGDRMEEANREHDTKRIEALHNTMGEWIDALITLTDGLCFTNDNEKRH